MLDHFTFLPTRRAIAFEGRIFKTGQYELISGRARLRIDPQHPQNRGIALIDTVHLDDKLTFDLQILQPLEPARGNGWLFYDVLNRGTKRAVQRINTGPFSNAPSTAKDAGNGFLMDRGFTIVWSGWQGDTPTGGDRMLAELPVAKGVTGPSREEFILDAPAPIREDGIIEMAPGRLRYRLSYAAVTDEPATLTWRLRAVDPRVARPDIAWRFVDDRMIEVDYPFHLDRGGLFEFIHTARDPMVMGLGLAVMRDTVSALRSGQGPVPPLRRALGFGLSQSGRVLRDFLREGFNQSLDGRPVFDAVIPIIAGSRGAFLNMPFAQPGRFSRQHEDHDFPGDQFPFAYQTMHDPVSGRTDGILKRAEAAGVVPKIMHMDTDSEYWSARASLLVTDTAGAEVPPPAEVRIYHAACVAHGDYDLPASVAAMPPNKLTYGPLIRAMVAAMTAWVDEGTQPPASCHPQGPNLVDPEAVRFPFPGPDFANGLRLADHRAIPPGQGAPYAVGVPAVDTDGNSVGGVVHPLLGAPLGAHTGWQLRRKGFAEGDFFNVFGGMMPFAPDVVAARYGDHAGWLNALEQALDKQIATGLLLIEDRDRVLAEAAKDWFGRWNFV